LRSGGEMARVFDRPIPSIKRNGVIPFVQALPRLAALSSPAW
jgi:hypothetical protein